MARLRLLSGLMAGAACLLSAASAMAVQVIVFPPSFLILSRTWGGPAEDTLVRTVSGTTAKFVLSGPDSAVFTLQFEQPAAGALSTYSDHAVLLSASWNKAIYPDVTLWSTSAGGGLTVADSWGDRGAILYNLFQAAPGYGLAQVYDVASIPEPATWSLMLIGVGGLGASLRRARTKPAIAS